MEVFGFEIRKKSKTPDDKKGVVQVVVPANTEGTRDIISHGPLGGHFVEVYDSGVVDTDEYNLIKKYREMSECTEIDKAISEMKRVVKQQGALIFIDFQVPLPKNVWAMFARIIEFLAGGSHYQGFKDYLRNGGLNQILKDHQLLEEYAHRVKGGIAVIIKARNI